MKGEKNETALPLKLLRLSNDKVVISVGSGTYHFIVK